LPEEEDRVNLEESRHLIVVAVAAVLKKCCMVELDIVLLHWLVEDKHIGLGNTGEAVGVGVVDIAEGWMNYTESLLDNR
jgi:hypothetical protein